MKLRRVLMLFCAWALLAGLVMRWAGIGHAGWIIGGAAAALVFLFLLPVMGERSRQPPDAPERRVQSGE